MKIASLTAVAVLASGLTVPAFANPPLSQERYINDRLIAARVADRIRRECPSLNGRVVYAYGEARKLQRYALNQGYSKAEIDRFLDDRKEKDRIYAVAERYLIQQGARKGDPESFCKVGRQEMANRTVSGSLLVAR
ncbi:MAG: hypothetical protein DI498_07695 [Paracoccus denitrificans]|nr:MAG: hypothetical protein DI498_07695 [Paracoccus denitrificans]PZO84411.1 MAG: hypothetical protein DI633_07695 [Paracoccus denitrificans]